MTHNGGKEDKDDKEVTILGRTVRVTQWGYEYEADPKHREIVPSYFGLEEGSKSLKYNGD